MKNQVILTELEALFNMKENRLLQRLIEKFKIVAPTLNMQQKDKVRKNSISGAETYKSKETKGSRKKMSQEFR